MISKSDLSDWKSNPVTKAYFQAIRIKIEDVKNELLGISPEELRFKQGAIWAYLDTLDVEIDLNEDEE